MLNFSKYLNESCDCWKNYKRKPGTKPCAPGSCVKEETVTEGERGLWDNIHAKQKRIKAGSGEKMRKPGSKGAPTAAALKASQTNEETELQEEHLVHVNDGSKYGDKPHPDDEKHVMAGVKKHHGEYDGMSDKGIFFKFKKHEDAKAFKRHVDSCPKRSCDADLHEEYSADAQFDLIEEFVTDLAEEHNIDPEIVWEKLESIDDEELYEAAVDAKGHKSSTGGLTQKGRDHYNSQSGGNLKAPVTTPPSELKAGSKAANRRKSFCARMGGMEGSMKKPNGEPTRKALALRKWNC